MEMARRALILTALMTALIVSAAYLCLLQSTVSSKQLIVFCAGSLYTPLERLKERYELLHPGTRVIIEPSGSMEAVRKVVELGRRCDVLALADYELVTKLMSPKHANWCIAFATDELVLAYTDRSRYADEVGGGWLEVLLKPDVRLGFSNPNQDPCGYRALTALALASLRRGGLEVFNELVAPYINIRAERVGDMLHIYVPAELRIEGGRLGLRAKSVDLIALLEAGDLDYAFEYRGVAVQRGLRFIDLPPEVNLGSLNHTDLYAKVTIHLMSGASGEVVVRGAPIMYGVTIPSTAGDVEGALGFIKLLLSSVGREVFEGLGQRFLEKPACMGEVPEALKA
jgi:molybdate/tungstate transport system substrate-binding protein